MRKYNFLIVLAILVFIFTIIELSWGDEAAIILEEGMIESSGVSTLDSDFLKDERIMDLEQEYAAYLEALWADIQNESDPLKREQLQREVQALKEEREIKLKELQLEIAIEQGDEVREMEILEALDSLYEPKVVQPSFQEPRQKPETGSIKSKAPSKNPDDA